MCRIWSWLLLCATLLAQQSNVPETSNFIMLAAVSRDESMLVGGIGPSKFTSKGTVTVEPLAFLNEAGDWKNVPCGPGNDKACRKFERDYLSKPHVYIVVSADGNGATVRSARTTLDECYFFAGKGTYSGAPIQKSAVAASSVEPFAASPELKQLEPAQAREVRKALVGLVPRKLDSTSDLRIFSLSLENQNLIVVQRAFGDISNPDINRRKLVFAIGALGQGRFQTLHWKKNIEDEDERVIGTIGLKGGRQFLITVVSDPESQSFRVYGIRDGQLSLVWSGGGSSC